MDYTKIYRTDVAALLGPGEQVLAIVPYQHAPGAEQVQGPPEELERRLPPLARKAHRRVRERNARERRSARSSWPFRLLFLDFDWPWNRTDVDEKLSGIAVAGTVGSHAVRIFDATKRVEGDYLVVTDQRFIVVHRVGTDRLEWIVDAARADIVFARRASRLFQRGRVIIGFADESKLAVLTGVIVAGQAKRLVTAFSPQ
jgi:hypothetical protein